MPTARTVTIDALRALKAIAPGDDPTADELATALAGVNALILELHEARGPPRMMPAPAPTRNSEEKAIMSLENVVDH